MRIYKLIEDSKKCKKFQKYIIPKYQKSLRFQQYKNIYKHIQNLKSRKTKNLRP